MRGYFGIGVYHPKTEHNIGTLWRSAYLMGASFIFVIGKRYHKQASDTLNSIKHIPLYNYPTFEEFYKNLPYDCPLVCIEMSKKAVDLREVVHPERCVYLLGAEDHGLPEKVMKGRSTIFIPYIRNSISLNVAVAGSVVMYDRMAKLNLN